MANAYPRILRVCLVGRMSSRHDSFSRSIHFCCEKRFCKSYFVGHQKVEFSHLQFLDDTLVFCKNGEDNLHKWWFFLKLFLKGAGLSLNLDKTSLIGIWN